MICPKCNKPKTAKDFYYRKYEGNIKVRKECKTCLSEEHELKKKGLVVKGNFNLNDFAKHYKY